MEEKFEVNIARLNRKGIVEKSAYYLSILREGSFSVSVERLPLVEYFVFFDHPVKAEQLKVKIYKTLDGRWYDKYLSEEAEIYSPEFGIPDINNELKQAIDEYESQHVAIVSYA